MRIRSFLSAAVSVALVFGGAMFTDVAADVTKETPGAGEARPDPATLTFASTEPVVTDAKATLEFDSLVRNPGTSELPAGSFAVEISDAPVQSLEQLDDPSTLTFTPLTTVQVGAVPAATKKDAGKETEGELSAADLNAGELRTRIEVAAGELPFTNTTPQGTYLVRASLVPAEPTDDADVVDGADDALLSATSPIVWRGGSDKSTDENTGTDKNADMVALSVIVPFVLPDSVRSMPSREQLADLSPAWDDLLTAAEGARATLAIDPRIVASIRGYGTDAPADARDFLLRLEASTSPSFLLQFADADVSAQAALGFTSLLSPTNLDFVTRHGKFEAPEPEVPEPEVPEPEVPEPAESSEPAAPKAPGESGEPGEPSGGQQGAARATDGAGSDGNDADGAGNTSGAENTAGAGGADAKVAAPTLEELLTWPAADSSDSDSDSTVWPAEGNVDSRTFALLDAAGIRSIVLDSNNVKSSGGPRALLNADGTAATDATTPDAVTTDALITDAGLAAAATAVLTGDTEVDQAAGRASLAAQLAVRAQAAGPGVVLGLDRGAMAAAADPASILTALSEFDFVRATRVTDQEVGTATLKAAGPLEPRLALLRSASDREASVNEIGAALVQPQYLSGYQRARLLDLFATRYAPAEANFDAAASRFRARDAELLEGVQVISTEHTQLVGATTNVPVQLHNSLPFEAEVTVTVVPVSAAVDVKQRVFTGVRIEAEGNERVLVPVHSRVSSGESGLVVTVSATGGKPTVFTGTLGLSISTTVETVALWLLGVSAVVLFVAGVVRSVRKRRERLAKPVSVPASEPVPTAAGADPESAESANPDSPREPRGSLE